MPNALPGAPHRGIGVTRRLPVGQAALPKAAPRALRLRRTAALAIAPPTLTGGPRSVVNRRQKQRLALGRPFNASAHQLSGSGRVQRLCFQMTHS